jgi:hypothetical protein
MFLALSNKVLPSAYVVWNRIKGYYEKGYGTVGRHAGNLEVKLYRF